MSRADAPSELREGEERNLRLKMNLFFLVEGGFLRQWGGNVDVGGRVRIFIII